MTADFDSTTATAAAQQAATEANGHCLDEEVYLGNPLSQHDFDELHGGHKRILPSISQRLHHLHKKHCSKQGSLAILNAVFPFVSTLKGYSIKSHLLRDALAGLTVCVMHIPQGMAYGLLAGMPPVYGLYTSMIPVLAYFVFGTSRHISIGTLAVVSLQINEAVQTFLLSPSPAVSVATIATQSPVNLSFSTDAYLNTSTSDFPSASKSETMSETGYMLSGQVYTKAEFRLEVVVALTLLTGLVQLLMGIARFGFLTIYLSDSMINGFITGLSFHIATSQIFYIVGYRPSWRYSGFLKLVYIYFDLLCNIPKFNVATLLLSVLFMAVLLIVKETVQPLLNKKLKFPIPIDFIVIVCGMLLGRFMDLSTWRVSVVGPIPAGLPKPRVPNASLFPNLIVSAISIAIVGFAQTISLAKMFGLKHGYQVDGNQELIALGASNIAGSFFSCFACSASISRSAVQEAAGARTQISGLISSAGLLITLLLLAPLFQTLPHFILASIIMVALKSMLLQFRSLPHLWRISKYDFAIWTVSCAAVVLSEPDLGLVAGLLFSLFTVIVRTQSPYSCLLGQVRGTSLYTDINAYDNSAELQGVKIFRFDGPLYYASAENFRKAFYNKTRIQKAQPLSEARDKHNGNGNGNDIDCNDVSNAELITDKRREGESTAFATKYVILDCNPINFIDATGVRTLEEMQAECKKIGVTLLFASVREPVRESLNKVNFLGEKWQNIAFISTHDAILWIFRKENSNSIAEMNHVLSDTPPAID